ncbi:aldolase [Paracoccus liaowanqingii]|uniref:Aldolase n=1 Tax=Paracoccus liaowanqingii TaxID=2560053 RepID=A0A4Z1CKC0_9RHOB|nr:aldolase/citrate lyase family protein [Paracoccus liaowanqingii]TGN49522.1 aldolase [Paracoccus liaowanqingii]
MNRLKRRIAQGDRIEAAWLQLGSPDIAEILARHGWDVLVIDGEHGRGDIEDWVAVARAARAAGAEVILRVPDGSDTMLKRVLDRSFTSIIVPMVETGDQAREVAAACLYPPRGRRGYAAPLVRASDWGARAGYGPEAADELLLIVQCETGPSVGNLPEIMAVAGVDMVFIGPNDLAASIGHLERMTDPEPQALIARIEAAGMPLGTITGAGRDWDDLRALGYRLIVGGSDVAMVVAGARGVAKARGEGDLPPAAIY